MSRSAPRGTWVAAGTTAVSARIEIANPDGYLDGLGAVYSVAGRRVRVLALGQGGGLAGADLVLDGSVAASSFDEQRISLHAETKDAGNLLHGMGFLKKGP